MYIMILFLSLLYLLLTGLLQIAEGSLHEPALKLETNYTFQISLSSPLSVYYQLNETTEDNALRVYTASENAIVFQPVLVSVKQCKGVTSWSIPFVENGLSYNKVYRLLCPLLTSFASSQFPVILIDFSTSNMQPTNITLRMDVKKHYYLELDQPKLLIASPINPSYLFFKYPPGVNEVKVKINSSPDTKNTCALASIQNVYCPEVELMDSHDARGKFQTMRSLAAFNVQKHHRGSPYEFFYVVLSVYPNNGPLGDCDYESESFELADNFHPVPYTGPSRVKHVTVTVETTLSGDDYWIAVVVGLTVMFVFYFVYYAWIIVFDWWRYDNHSIHNALADAGYTKDTIKLRPTLLSMISGVHWKKLAEKIKAASISDSSPTHSAIPLVSPPTNQTSQFDVNNFESLRRRNTESAVLFDPPSPTQSDYHDSKQPILGYKHDKHPLPVKVLMSELGELDEHQRAFDGYPFYLLVVGTFYALPVYQLLITLRHIMASGNEDVCYHNFLCAHPWELWGVPLSAVNNMFSNIAFFLLGILSILITYRRSKLYRCYVEINQKKPLAERIGVPQNFGIFYGAGIAMIGQAIMSTAYHMCPSWDNFKFDATFIYVQFGIGIHKLLQSRNPDKKPSMHFILLLLAFLVVVVMIGTTLSDSPVFWTVFSVVSMLLSLIAAVEIYYRWQIPLTRRGVWRLLSFYSSHGFYPPRHELKFVFSSFMVVLNWSIIYVGAVFYSQKFAVFILMAFVCNILLHISYYVIAKVKLGEIKCCPLPKVIVFAVLTVIFWIVAVIAYLLETIDWSVSPAKSRDVNSDCLLLGFYDAHDIWHFLSAIATFFVSMLLQTLDDRQKMWTRDKILTF